MAKIRATKEAKEARKMNGKKVEVQKVEVSKVEIQKEEKVVETKQVEKAKETVEKVVKKQTTKPATIQVIYQFAKTETTEKALIAAVKEIWTGKGNKIKDIQSLNIYIKPEEKKAYYVINDTENGQIDL